MIRGFVIGKFCPLHTGHIALIEFARQHCDELVILVCASDKETITGSVRLQWLQQTFIGNAKIKPALFQYLENELPNTSVSSRAVSKCWANKIQLLYSGIDIVFSSEPYGDYLAELLNCRHLSFEPARNLHKISATDIRTNPFRYWHFIAASARPFFVKKICISGTESTGKSTLANRLALHYQTGFVSEMARGIIDQTNECTEQHLQLIAKQQARAIKEKLQTANRILFVDTDINITRSYSKFLFNKNLYVPDWIEKVHQYDLYLYLENDAPYIQDGTRLDLERRNRLNIYYKKELADRSIPFELVTGNWQERFEKSVSIIDQYRSAWGV